MTLSDLECRMARTNDLLSACPALREISSLSDVDFHRLLIQRRFISLAFTPFYDTIIDALHNDGARLVCRQIVREEYPDGGGNELSHRELLVKDLVTLGISKHELVVSRPTAATAYSIAQSFELVLAASTQEHSDVALIATAACYGETLVATEYGAFTPRIEKVLPLAATAFYGPHVSTDGGHAKRLLDEIWLIIDDHPEQLAAFDEAVMRCLRVKLDFYRQFEVDAARGA